MGREVEHALRDDPKNEEGVDYVLLPGRWAWISTRAGYQIYMRANELGELTTLEVFRPGENVAMLPSRNILQE